MDDISARIRGYACRAMRDVFRAFDYLSGVLQHGVECQRAINRTGIGHVRHLMEGYLSLSLLRAFLSCLWNSSVFVAVENQACLQF